MAIGDKITYKSINYSVIRIGEVQVGYGYTVAPHTSAVSRDFASEKITIPPFIDHDLSKYRVTEISAHAFYSCELIKAIEIPYTVTLINWSAFGRMFSLEKVIIPPNTRLRSLGNGVIHSCYKLQNFFIPNTVTSIAKDIFFEYNLSIWYGGTRKFDVAFTYNKCVIHVPYSYKYETFGNIQVVKDYIWPPFNCVTLKPKSNYHIDMLLFAIVSLT